MLAAAAFVLGFIVVALSVVGLAMQSGKRRKGGPTREQRTATYTALAIVSVLIAVVVPALVLVNNNESKAKDTVGGVDLTDGQVEGRQLFKENCSTCHQLKASNAVGKVGPNLDALKPAKALSLNAIELGRAAGRGQMPANLLGGEDAENVASYIEAVAGRDS